MQYALAFLTKIYKAFQMFVNSKFFTGFFVFCATIASYSAFGDGFVRVSEKNPNYFELSDSSAYIPLGYNLSFPRFWDKLSEEESFAMIEKHLKNIAENGGNYARIWISHPFYEIEDSRPGVYNPKKFARIDRLVGLAQKYGVRLKICLEHFRNIRKYRPAENESGLQTHIFQRPAYAGEFANMKEYFSSQKGRDLFFNRFEALFKKYSDNPIIFAWELWNEQNTVQADAKVVKEWEKYMFKRMGEVCKNQMIVNSYGSLDSDSSKKAYKFYYNDSSNMIAAVHRYLDEGAAYDVCHGPVDLAAADAIKEIKEMYPEHPALLAETGAVQPKHSGPWRYYDADTDGIIFHDALYTPFFCGSAGGGQPWHWDVYIYKHELWRHLKPFSALLEKIDPRDEDFKPFRADTKKLRVYALDGKKTLLAFARDIDNNWVNEFEKGIKPSEISGETIDFTNAVKGRKISKVRVYDLWGGGVNSAEPSAKVSLPPFKRSCAVRIDFE